MKQYKLNGKYVNKEQIPEEAILKRVVDEEHYETPEYSKQQTINASIFFKKLQQDREDLEQRHG